MLVIFFKKYLHNNHRYTDNCSPVSLNSLICGEIGLQMLAFPTCYGVKDAKYSLTFYTNPLTHPPVQLYECRRM